MSRPVIEVADILRAQGNQFLERYQSSFSYQQMKAFRTILRCRSAALGGHIDVCLKCGHQEGTVLFRRRMRRASLSISCDGGVLICEGARDGKGKIRTTRATKASGLSGILRRLEYLWLRNDGRMCDPDVLLRIAPDIGTILA